MDQKNEIAIELVKLAKAIQPSITKTGTGIKISSRGKEFSVRQSRSSVINEARVRFR